MVATRIGRRLSREAQGSADRSGCRFISIPNPSDSDGVRRYDQAWLRKATNIIEGRRGNLN